MSRRVGNEDGLRSEDFADRPKAVHDQGRTRCHQVDDRLGQPEARRDLDGAGDRDDVNRDPAFLEEPTRCIRVGGGDAQAGEVLEPARRGVGRDGGRQPAAAVAELPDARQLRAGLHQQVDAGDAQVGHTVADELDDVVRPDEQDVEIQVLDAGDE